MSHPYDVICLWCERSPPLLLFLFDTARRQCILYRNYDLIANLGITLAAVTQYTDTKHFFGTTVIRYIQPAFLLNHIFKL